MKVIIAVLAAGRSTRMRGANKMLMTIADEPMVRRSVRHALATGRDSVDVVVVTGNVSAEIGKALAGLPVHVVENPHFETGIASSIKTALSVIPPETAGLMVHLADMPGVTGEHLARLIDVFVENDGGCVVQASHDGRAGNPAILPKSLFSEVARLQGDVGARDLIRRSTVVQIDIGAGASLDIDTPEDMEAYVRNGRRDGRD